MRTRLAGLRRLMKANFTAAAAMGIGLAVSTSAFSQTTGFGGTGGTGFGGTGGFGGAMGGMTGASGMTGAGSMNGVGGMALTNQTATIPTGMGTSSYGASGAGIPVGFGTSGYGLGVTGQIGQGLGLGATGGNNAMGGGLTNGLASSALGAATLSRSLGMGGASSFGRSSRGGFNSFNQTSQNQQENPIRATATLAFRFSPATSAARTREVNTRLGRIPMPDGFENVTVAMSGRTAIISGRVPTIEDGKLVERLLSLEPGIDAVQNQLQYETAVNAPAGIQPVPVAPSAATPR